MSFTWKFDQTVVAETSGVLETQTSRLRLPDFGSNTAAVTVDTAGGQTSANPGRGTAVQTLQSVGFALHWMLQ